MSKKVGRGGSRTVLWKYLDGLPPDEVAPGISVEGTDEVHHGCRVGVGPTIWEKYIGYGWVTEDKKLTKKGFKVWQQTEVLPRKRKKRQPQWKFTLTDEIISRLKAHPDVDWSLAVRQWLTKQLDNLEGPR